MYIYYPSCNFSAASPTTAKKVKAYFEKQMPVAGCCRVDKREIPLRISRFTSVRHAAKRSKTK